MGAPQHILSPHCLWVAKEGKSSMLVRPLSDLDLLPLVIPSEFPTVLSAQSGTSQAASCPLSSHYSLSLSFRSQASRKAYLHLLASFLTFIFLSNVPLPDFLFCVIKRLSRR